MHDIFLVIFFDKQTIGWESENQIIGSWSWCKKTLVVQCAYSWKLVSYSWTYIPQKWILESWIVSLAVEILGTTAVHGRCRKNTL
jgi:hypothetical protein